MIDVEIPPFGLPGCLRIPSNPRGVIVFAHGSGSSHKRPRNVYVAETLRRHGFASLLFSHLRGYFFVECVEAWFRKLNDLAGRNVDEMVVGRGDFVSRFSWSEMLRNNDACSDQMAQISVDGRQGHARPSRPQAFVQRIDIRMIRSGNQSLEDFIAAISLVWMATSIRRFKRSAEEGMPVAGFAR